MLQGQISCQRVLIEERHRLLRNISSSCEDVNNYTSLGMVATKNLYLELLDVKTTFLHDDLEEDLYMIQLERFIVQGQENLVCKLRKSLYGLK